MDKKSTGPNWQPAVPGSTSTMLSRGCESGCSECGPDGMGRKKCRGSPQMTSSFCGALFFYMVSGICIW